MYEPCSEPKIIKNSIAFFDFDGTLYLGDSFTKFIFYSLDHQHVIFQSLKLLPWVKGYYLNLYSAPMMRKKLFLKMFKGKNAENLQALGQEYANILLKDLNPILLAQLKAHQRLGHKVAIVSASIDIYLKPLCELLKVDLICSQPEIQNNLYTGEYLTPDCSCEQKRLGICNRYQIENFGDIYAYGNSDEDLAMLSLAAPHHQFMIGKNHKLPDLKKAH